MKSSFEILNKNEFPRKGSRIDWFKINKGFIIHTKHSEYGLNSFEFLEYIHSNHSRLKLVFEGNEVDIERDIFVKGSIGGILIKYKSYKNDVFEIYNKLKHNNKGIIWSDIEPNTTIKTKHVLYGYNEFKFLKYNKSTRILYMEFKGKPIEILGTSFIGGKIGAAIGAIGEFKYSILDIIQTKKGSLVITDKEYRRDKNNKQNKKWYKYTCNKCGWTEGWMEESGLEAGNGCSCCAGRTAVLGINTIWDTDRWMCDLGLSEEDAKKYTKGSGKKVEVVCPDCGSKKKMRVSSVYETKTISCKACGDGKSYPEKFIANVLNQLNVEFEVQLTKTTFEWCDKYKYDFYLSDYNTIIETHGEQHYEEKNSNSKFKISLAEQQEIDRIKQQLALQNNINKYIVIDCRNSDMEWIRDNTLSSELNKLFDLSNIDWVKCEEFALSNLVREVCNYWNCKKEWETTTTIAKNNPWGIKSKTTILTYLKKGTDLGWCYYNAKETMILSALTSNKLKRKQVEIFKGEKSFGVFESVSELSRQSLERFGVKLNNGEISKVCNGKKPQYKGFTFKYATETEENNIDENNLKESA